MYKFVDDLTSDVMFVAEGKDLSELLEQASMALFDVVCQRDRITPEKSIEIEIESENPKELVHEWLSKLLTESDANEMFFSKFEIRVEEKNGKLFAHGKIWGEPYSPEKGETVVKGVTYYNFSVEKTEKGWRAKIVCDI